MFDQLFHLIPDALVLVDGEGKIVAANEQADKLFGYPSGGLLGLAVETLMPAKVRERHQEHRSQFAAHPRVRPMGAGGQALIGQRRDGTEFPVEIALSPVTSPDGRRFLASVRDISETQRARQALVRARYDRLVARVGQIALAAAEESDVFERLPGEIAETLGVEAVAIVSARASSSGNRVLASSGLSEPSVPWSFAFGDALARALATNQAQIVEDAQSDPAAAGGMRQAGFRSSLIVPLVERDRPMGALVALSKQAHSFDHDALHCLQSVANLVSALMQRRRAEEQLAHSQRLEAIGQLTGGIAHDFNNLLTVVSGNLQLLELEIPDQPAVQELTASALRAVEHGAALTSKLLAFARRQRLTPRVVAPEAVLRELGGILHRTLGDKARIEISPSSDVASIHVDLAQFESALLNLALNARDAMPRGGTLTIAAHDIDLNAETADALELQPGRYVVFSLTDTGLGMSPDVLARAFEPFFTTKESGKGNGLGLSMVYGFARQSGGQLAAHSRLGYGTRMEIYLPAAPQAAVPSPPVDAPAAPGRSHERVLVVEDEPGVRDVAVAFLRSFGYEVLAVSNAEDALEVLDVDASIALLFSDVALGAGMNGFELAFAARARRPALRVLLTSGYDHPEGSVRDSQGDELELLPKPYRREELATALRRQFEKG